MYVAQNRVWDWQMCEILGMMMLLLSGSTPHATRSAKCFFGTKKAEMISLSNKWIIYSCMPRMFIH